MITAPDLDELTITIVVDNTTDTLSSIAPGVPQLPEIAYLLGRIPPNGQHDGHDCVVAFVFDWSRSLEDPTEYVLVEAFRDQDAGGAHVHSAHFKQAIAALPRYLLETPASSARRSTRTTGQTRGDAGRVARALRRTHRTRAASVLVDV